MGSEMCIRDRRCSVLARRMQNSPLLVWHDRWIAGRVGSRLFASKALKFTVLGITRRCRSFGYQWFAPEQDQRTFNSIEIACNIAGGRSIWGRLEILFLVVHRLSIATTGGTNNITESDTRNFSPTAEQDITNASLELKIYHAHAS